MKVLTQGHLYELDQFESTAEDGGNQRIQFIHKEPINPGAQALETISNGTTNEEVLAMLIDRMYFLQTKFPCRENSIVITKLEESLMWLNKRTNDRKNRGVEGKNQK